MIYTDKLLDSYTISLNDNIEISINVNSTKFNLTKHTTITEDNDKIVITINKKD